jgi:hypothetical protein
MRYSNILYSSSIEVISIIAFAELFIANLIYMRYSD